MTKTKTESPVDEAGEKTSLASKKAPAVKKSKPRETCETRPGGLTIIGQKPVEDKEEI